MLIAPAVSGLVLAATAAVAAAGAAESVPSAPAPADPLTVEATGDCPSREGVLAALEPVLAKDALRPPHDPPRVIDLGGRFEVKAAGQTGQYFDPARDCAERARTAAVFIALALNPPTFRSTSPPAAAEPPPVVPPPAPPGAGAGADATGGAPWQTRLAVAARLDSRTSTEGARSSVDFVPGAEIRSSFERRGLGLAVGAGVLMSTMDTFGSVPVRQQRFPLSFAVTARRALSGSFEGSVGLGASVVPLTLRAERLATGTSETRLDVGVRLALELGYAPAHSRVAPFVSLHAEYFPRSYVLTVDPVGQIGSTNHLWIGASAGVALQRRRDE